MAFVETKWIRLHGSYSCQVCSKPGIWSRQVDYDVTVRGGQVTRRRSVVIRCQDHVGHPKT